MSKKIILSILILIISLVVLFFGIMLYYIHKIDKEVTITDFERKNSGKNMNNIRPEVKEYIDSLRNRDYTIKDDTVQFYNDTVFELTPK